MARKGGIETDLLGETVRVQSWYADTLAVGSGPLYRELFSARYLTEDGGGAGRVRAM